MTRTMFRIIFRELKADGTADVVEDGILIVIGTQPIEPKADALERLAILSGTEAFWLITREGGGRFLVNSDDIAIVEVLS